MKSTSPYLKQILHLLSMLGLAAHYSCCGALAIVDTRVNPANGHTYHLLDNSNWTDAENQAVLLGGHLATINNAAENSWVWNLWGSSRSLWIGFNDAASEGNFEWANGETATFTNWNPGEPNDGNNGEDYAYIYSDILNQGGLWNDYQNDSTVFPEPPLYGVVEVVPEPSPSLLLACGSLAGLLMWQIRSKRRP